jgi:AcrR family transcriptional regulator
MTRIAVPLRRAALIEAALRVIARQGVAEATTRAIAAEAKMSLASLHYAFGSRDELIAAVIAHVVQRQAGAALGALDPRADMVTIVRQGFRAYLAVIAADPEQEQALAELTQYALRTPNLTISARQVYESYYSAAEQLLVTVAEATGHEWTRPLGEMARIIVTLTDGLSVGWLVNRDTEASERVIDFAAQSVAALARRRDQAPA